MDWNVTSFSRYNNLSRLKWWHDSTCTKAPLKWIWPPIMLICTATWEWSSQPRDWLKFFPHLYHEVEDLNHVLTWGGCRGWAQGGRGGGGAEGSIASRGVVVPRQGQALLFALAKRFLKNAHGLESEPLKCIRKQATWMYEEGEKRKKGDDNDYTDDNYDDI